MRSARRAVGIVLLVGTAGCGDDASEGGDSKGGNAGAGGAGAAPSGGSATNGGTGAANGGSISTGGSGSGTGGGSGTAGGATTDYEPPAEIIGGACTGTPVFASEPCSFGAEQSYCSLADPTKAIMVVCSTAGRTQCESVEECEAGWHACTATDYVAYGGRDVPPNFSATNRAWLAACARDLGDVGLKNEPCGSCDLIVDFEPVVQWWCDGSVVYAGGMSGDTLGVHTNAECMRVGTNDADHGAFWTMDFTGGGGNFVMCCLDDP
jgi:hypothetical protein